MRSGGRMPTKTRCESSSPTTRICLERTATPLVLRTRVDIDAFPCVRKADSRVSATDREPLRRSKTGGLWVRETAIQNPLAPQRRSGMTDQALRRGTDRPPARARTTRFWRTASVTCVIVILGPRPELQACGGGGREVGEHRS